MTTFESVIICIVAVGQIILACLQYKLPNKIASNVIPMVDIAVQRQDDRIQKRIERASVDKQATTVDNTQAVLKSGKPYKRQTL